MPTYDYVCDACGTFEVYQGIKETPLAACPTCGGAVKRKIGAGGGLLFKGSGFYVTDYRSKAYEKKARADTAVPPSTGDAKPAAAGSGSAGAPPSAPESGKGPSGTPESARPAPDSSGAAPGGQSGASGPSTPPASSSGKPAGGEKTS